jgi:hypothetical protein
VQHREYAFAQLGAWPTCWSVTAICSGNAGRLLGKDVACQQKSNQQHGETSHRHSETRLP